MILTKITTLEFSVYRR